jgi:hypothetical protein
MDIFLTLAHSSVDQHILPFIMARNLRIDPTPPPENLKHWHPRDKAAVVLAIRQGVIRRSEARARYMLSDEELSGWEDAFDCDGLAGLQVKRPLWLG